MKKYTILLLFIMTIAYSYSQTHSKSLKGFKAYYVYAFIYVENNTLLITDIVEIKGINTQAQASIFKSDNNNRFIRFVRAHYPKIYQSRLPSYKLNTMIVNQDINEVRKNRETKIKQSKNKLIYVKNFKFNQLFGKANKRDFKDYR